MDLSQQTNDIKPTVVIFVGMAGSGKTTLVNWACCTFPVDDDCRWPLILNLDPAAVALPPCAAYDLIDIRKIVHYDDLLNHFSLGRNAGVLPCLDLVAHHFHKFISIIEKRTEMYKYAYILVDTPGQMEVFNSSASGALIVEAFASKFPTVIAYVIDTPACSTPYFPSVAVLQACDLRQKTGLSPVLTFNKVNVAQGRKKMKLKKVRDSFANALSSLCSSRLTQILGVQLGEFGPEMLSVEVSGDTNEGIDHFLDTVEASAEDYMRTYNKNSSNPRANIDESWALKKQYHDDEGKGTEILQGNPEITLKKGCTEECKGQHHGFLFAFDLEDENAWTDAIKQYYDCGYIVGWSSDNDDGDGDIMICD